SEIREGRKARNPGSKPEKARRKGRRAAHPPRGPLISSLRVIDEGDSRPLRPLLAGRGHSVRRQGAQACGRPRPLPANPTYKTGAPSLSAAWSPSPERALPRAAVPHVTRGPRPAPAVAACLNPGPVGPAARAITSAPPPPAPLPLVCTVTSWGPTPGRP